MTSWWRSASGGTLCCFASSYFAVVVVLLLRASTQVLKVRLPSHLVSLRMPMLLALLAAYPLRSNERSSRPAESMLSLKTWKWHSSNFKNCTSQFKTRAVTLHGRKSLDRRGIAVKAPGRFVFHWRNTMDSSPMWKRSASYSSIFVKLRM